MKTSFLTILLLSLSIYSFSQASFSEKLSNAAIELTRQKVDYDPAYFVIDYPNGDIPFNKGICTDVIIRAYRKVGIDLQKEVHEDMKANIRRYTKFWKHKKLDTNMDHRKVENLMVFFDRFATKGPLTDNVHDYMPGDIVCWDLGKGVKHIGIVVCMKQPNTDRYMVVHNIGGGQVLADCLFAFKIIGHYQYEKKTMISAKNH